VVVARAAEEPALAREAPVKSMKPPVPETYGAA
jgi:hypothetical protein